MSEYTQKPRIADVKQHITDVRRLLKGYEDIIDFGDDPKKILNAKKQVRICKKQLRTYEEELKKLEQSKNIPVKAPLAPLVPVPPPPLTKIESSLQELKEDIKKVIAGQETILDKLDGADRLRVDSIIKAFHEGRVSANEIITTLSLVEKTVQTIQAAQNLKDNEIHDSLQKIQNDLAISHEMSLQHKLEVSIPLIPTILNLRTEFSVGDAVDFGAVWDELKNRWKMLILRGNRNLWSSDTILRYGELIKQNNPTEPEDIFNLAYRSFQTLYENYSEIYDQLIGLNAKLERGSNNPKTFLEGLANIERLADEIHPLLQNIDTLATMIKTRMLYPTSDLLRMQELISTIAARLHTAASQAASRLPTGLTTGQLKGDFSNLLKIYEQFLLWLRNMIVLAE